MSRFTLRAHRRRRRLREALRVPAAAYVALFDPASGWVWQDELMLLAADLKDDAIGRQLGVTRRSVQRRIRKLIESFGASSRLQLLIDCARKGIV